MCVPGLATDEATFLMLDQASDHMGGQRTLAHVRQRLGIDDVVVVAGAQQLTPSLTSAADESPSFENP